MIDPLIVDGLIERAIAEDVGFCDLTSELVIPAGARATLALNAREDIVVAGIEVAARVFRRREPGCSIELNVADGERVKAGGAMGRVEGDARGHRLRCGQRQVGRMAQGGSPLTTGSSIAVTGPS